jgi:septal ring factor EnvC (AmiA/AmiB activator)
MADYFESQFTISCGEDSATAKDASQLDSAGQAILKLLHRAAGAAEANSTKALETAQRLASQVQAAEDRIAELEAELHESHDRADRAEEWLRKIATEIENRLISEPEERRSSFKRYSHRLFQLQQ